MKTKTMTTVILSVLARALFRTPPDLRRPPKALPWLTTVSISPARLPTQSALKLYVFLLEVQDRCILRIHE